MTKDQQDRAWNQFKTVVTPIFCSDIHIHDCNDYLNITYKLGSRRFGVKVDEHAILDKYVIS